MSELLNPQKAFIAELRNLQTNSKLSDLLIRCGSREWHVHKVILCSQSGYFAKACTGHSKKVKKSLIVLEQDEPIIVEAMMSYLYCFEYSYDPFDLRFGEEWFGSIDFHIHVRNIANKYRLQYLEEQATINFAKTIEKEWSSPSFVQAIMNVFGNGDTECPLRKALISVSHANSRDLFTEAGDKIEFRQTVKNIPDFMDGLAAMLATQPLVLDG